MPIDTTRRQFLVAAPLVAASASTLLAQSGKASASAAAAEPFRLLTADMLKTMRSGLNGQPGNANVIETAAIPLTIVMTNEEKKSPKDYEWHEGRDHIFQILEGSTTYELGGTPVGARNTKPGEWLAGNATGAQTVTLNAGDMLVIPRGMPHKRTTADRVTFLLISDTAPAPVK